MDNRPNPTSHINLHYRRSLQEVCEEDVVPEPKPPEDDGGAGAAVADGLEPEMEVDPPEEEAQ